MRPSSFGPTAETEAPPSTAASALKVRERRSADGNEGIGRPTERDSELKTIARN
jgi:hypothetical protein